jgi:hypothetical protein
LPLFSALLMQRKASANEFIRTMVAVGTFYLQKLGWKFFSILIYSLLTALNTLLLNICCSNTLLFS